MKEELIHAQKINCYLMIRMPKAHFGEQSTTHCTMKRKLAQWVVLGKVKMCFCHPTHLIFICLLCLSLYSQAAVAEKVNTETGISYCMQSVFVQGNMYIVSDNGIWMRQLTSGNEEMIVSLQRIQTAWGISSTFSLFARNDSFGIVDWENGKIWMWEDGEFVLLSDLGANILIDESQRMSCVSAGDLLWALTSGKLLTVSTITGEMKMSHISGVQEINSYSDTGILIVYSTNGTREICSVSSLSHPPFFLLRYPIALTVESLSILPLKHFMPLFLECFQG